MGMSVCDLCPKGMFSTVAGATSSDVCTSCDEGKYAKDSGSSVCTECIARCQDDEFLKQQCSATTKAICETCTVCPHGKYALTNCTNITDTDCDVNQTTYITFTVSIKVNQAQFDTKARTFMVAVGETVFGIPSVDAAGMPITDWEGMKIPDKLSAFRGNIALGPLSEYSGTVYAANMSDSSGDGGGRRRQFRSQPRGPKAAIRADTESSGDSSHDAESTHDADNSTGIALEGATPDEALLPTLTGEVKSWNKVVTVVTVLKQPGPEAAATLSQTMVACDGCRDALGANMVGYGIATTEGESVLLGYTVPVLATTISVPLSSAAPPRPAPAALAPLLLLAAAAAVLGRRT